MRFVLIVEHLLGISRLSWWAFILRLREARCQRDIFQVVLTGPRSRMLKTMQMKVSSSPAVEERNTILPTVEPHPILYVVSPLSILHTQVFDSLRHPLRIKMSMKRSADVIRASHYCWTYVQAIN